MKGMGKGMGNGMGNGTGGNMSNGPSSVNIEAASNGYLVSTRNPKTGKEQKVVAKTMGEAKRCVEDMFKNGK